jgi:hypothetical protein
VSQTRAGWKLLEQSGIASSEHNIVSLHRALELLDDLFHLMTPFPLVATYSYVNPLVAILLGYSLGKELITPRILLAAGLIIGSVVLVSAPR